MDTSRRRDALYILVFVNAVANVFGQHKGFNSTSAIRSAKPMDVFGGCNSTWTPYINQNVLLFLRHYKTNIASLV